MTSATPERRSKHNEYQRRYYARPRRNEPRMSPGARPYVTRHTEQVVTAAGLSAGQRVVEVGCGMGRFTQELLARGIDVTGIDLSPDLLAELHNRLGTSIPTACCDTADAPKLVPSGFDAAIGFFVLHHLVELDVAFRSIASMVRPGGALVFAEPNGFNPLFYLQIVLTPGVTWRGDGGVRRMRPSVVGGAMRRAGLLNASARTYGYLPPLLYNRRTGRRLESALDRLLPLSPVRAFQLFAGRVPA